MFLSLTYLVFVEGIQCKCILVLICVFSLVMYMCVCVYNFLSSPEDIFSLLLQRREKHQRERETSIDCFLYVPRPGIICTWNLKPRYVPFLGIKLTTFQLRENVSAEPHHPGQVTQIYFDMFYFTLNNVILFFDMLFIFYHAIVAFVILCGMLIWRSYIYL